MRRAERMLSWAVDMFGRIALDTRERAIRFVEEALEVGHVLGLERAVIDRAADRIWGRSRIATEAAKEIGQAAMTLECLAEVMELSAIGEAEHEFRRVRSIPKAEWVKRHDRKVRLGFARWAPGDEPASTEGQ